MGIIVRGILSTEEVRFLAYRCSDIRSENLFKNRFQPNGEIGIFKQVRITDSQ